jgi:hypothetical protein
LEKIFKKKRCVICGLEWVRSFCSSYMRHADPCPVPNVQEKPTRVNVSFRRSTLLMIDRKAEAAGMTRSGFLSRAADSFQMERRGQ